MLNSINYRLFNVTPYSPAVPCTQGAAIVKAWLLNVFVCSSSCSAENSLRLQELARTFPKTDDLSQALIRDLNTIRARCIAKEYDPFLKSDTDTLLSDWETPSLDGIRSPVAFRNTQNDHEERVGSALKRSCIRSVTPTRKQNNITHFAEAVLTTPQKIPNSQNSVLTPNSVTANSTPIASKIVAGAFLAYKST